MTMTMKGTGTPSLDEHDGGMQVRRIRRLMQVRELPLLVILVVCGAVLTGVTPDFLTVTNLNAIGLGLVDQGVIAVTMAVLPISGGFDLSVGGILAVSGIICGELLVHHMPMAVAIAVTLALGGLLGAINGFVVTVWRVNPLIATLGSASIAEAAALVITNTAPVSGFSPAFLYIGEGTIGGVSVGVIGMLVLILLADLLLRRLRALRSVYYIGSNPLAAAYSGISVARVQFVTYVASGIAGALAGIFVTSRLNSAFPTSGLSDPLNVIAACVIGGASLSGGQGTILGAFLGVLLLNVIDNAIILLNINVNWQGAVSGAILIVAVALNELHRRRPGAES